MRIFVSSTLKDMRDYRTAVIEALRLMGLKDIENMEEFETSDKDATTLSLEKLRHSDVYIGVFGHRYGHVPDDALDDFKSITLLEYEQALALSSGPKSKPRLLIYLADAAMAFPNTLREPEKYHNAQKSFRERVSSKHTPYIFKDENELRARVSSDVARLVRDVKEPPNGRIAWKLFDESDDKLIAGEFDERSEEQLEAIEKCLEFVQKQFESLFKLDGDHRHVHPFLRNLKRQLEIALPGILLDSSTGVLTRTGVRHVVLRAETFQALVQSIEVNRTLEQVGATIGMGAARDLVSNMIRKKHLVPKSKGALVTLWSFWDRTGGWGSLRLLNDDAHQSTAAADPPGQPQWRLRLDNNSLEIRSPDQSEAATRSIPQFWCGYIRGFLDTAVTELTELILRLPDEEQSKITWPAAHRVESVNHTRIQDGDRNADIFEVSFRVKPLAHARRVLSYSADELDRNQWNKSMNLTQSALKDARDAEGSAYVKTVRSLPDDNRLVVEQIVGPTEKWPYYSKDTAEVWHRLASRIIDTIAHELER